MSRRDENLLVSNFLFYLNNKIASGARDVLVEVCANFYEMDEITKGIDLLESTFNIRFSKRKKCDNLKAKLVNDVYDQLWSLDASSTKISHTFVADDLSRIPLQRETTDSRVPTEQILASIHNLKATIVQIQRNAITREMLDERLSNLSSSTSLPKETPQKEPYDALTPSAPPPTPLTPLIPSAPPLSQDDAGKSIQENPSLDAAEYAMVARRQKGKMKRKETGPPATSATSSSSTRPPLASRETGKRGGGSSVIIGKKVSSGEMSWRGADLTVARYIGRVSLGTTADDIRSFLESNNVEVISLEPIPVKHKLFSSFKLVVKRSFLPVIENPEIWPEGVSVGRYWAPKTPPVDGSTSSTLTPP